MGYAPKHAKPASLRTAALKSHNRSFGANDSGRHRAGVLPAPPAPRVPADESIGAVGTADPPTEVRSGEEAGEQVESPAGERGSSLEDTRGSSQDDGQPAHARDDRADAPMKFIPLQRVPLVGS